jgi:hypothetical protein
VIIKAHVEEHNNVSRLLQRLPRTTAWVTERKGGINPVRNNLHWGNRSCRAAIKRCSRSVQPAIGCANTLQFQFVNISPRLNLNHVAHILTQWFDEG